MDYEVLIEDERVEDLIEEHLKDPSAVDVERLTQAIMALIKEEAGRAFEEGQVNGHSQGYGFGDLN